jgi:hypothetical protein
MKDLSNELRRRDRDLRGMADEKRRSDERAAQAEAAHRAEIAKHHQVGARLDEQTAIVERLESRVGQLEQGWSTSGAGTATWPSARTEGDARQVRRMAGGVQPFAHVERWSRSRAASATRR